MEQACEDHAVPEVLRQAGDNAGAVPEETGRIGDRDQVLREELTARVAWTTAALSPHLVQGPHQVLRDQVRVDRRQQRHCLPCSVT